MKSSRSGPRISHRFIDGSYVKPITILPGYDRNWSFTLAVESYVSPRSGSITKRYSPRCVLARSGRDRRRRLACGGRARR